MRIRAENIDRIRIRTWKRIRPDIADIIDNNAFLYIFNDKNFYISDIFPLL